MYFDYFRTPISQNTDPATHLPRFETLPEARERRDHAVELLRNSDPALAAKLATCRKGRRCRSGACAICLRRFRRFFVSTVAASILNENDPPLPPRCWFRLSLVPPDQQFVMGKLCQFEPATVKDRLRKQVERNPVLSDATVIGGIDVSYEAGVWQPHFYFLAGLLRTDASFSDLKTNYPATPSTPRPLQTRAVESTKMDRLKVASYAFKARFVEIVPTKDSRGNPDTIKPSLEDPQLQELLPLLDQWGIGGRLVRRNLCGGLKKLGIR